MKYLLSVILAFGFYGCSASPKGAYALKTAEYGQCRSLKKGERIQYKKRLVEYVCEDNYVLIGKPYKIKDEWFYKSGKYNGKKVTSVSHTKVDKAYRNICQIEGSYGSGAEKIKKFYFDTKLKRCKSFEWSGKDGFAPFDSEDICEMHCYY